VKIILTKYYNATMDDTKWSMKCKRDKDAPPDVKQDCKRESNVHIIHMRGERRRIPEKRYSEGWVCSPMK